MLYHKPLIIRTEEVRNNKGGFWKHSISVARLSSGCLEGLTLWHTKISEKEITDEKSYTLYRYFFGSFFDVRCL